jgi:hypothetical protein
MLVLVTVSLLTAAPSPAHLKNTTVSSLWGKEAEGAAADPMMVAEPCWYKAYPLWLGVVSTGTAIAWYIMR